MAKFVAGTDVVTEDSAVSVDVSPDAPLSKGRHTFQLIVVDDDGLQSDPFTVEIVVLDDRKPTAIVKAPETVQLGQSFRLDGSPSSDLPPGKIVKYIWTLLK